MPLFAGDIGEIAFPEVPEQRKGLVIQRHENDIGQAVVVEIAGIHAHSRDELAVFGQRHAGVERTLLELTVALVVKVGIVDFIVGDEDIHPAIQVEIRDARLPCPCPDGRGFRLSAEMSLNVPLP